MTVLVDTSVWVGHFKQRDGQLVALLEAGLVACHPYVVVEVACGTPPGRSSHIIDNKFSDGVHGLHLARDFRPA